MKVIFAGTPEFAVPALTALIEAGHEIVLVLTQPDRPAGRGMHLKASPVKQLALQHGLPVFQPKSLKPLEVQDRVRAAAGEVMVVAAYGLIIPTAVLAMPLLGCYNIHASLLPRWRGAAPIHRAILAGDTETGVTIMQVVPALDAGDMVMKGVVPILEGDTTQSLHGKLSEMGAQLMVQSMQALARDGKLDITPQDARLVTYAHKLEKAEATLDWSQSAQSLSRQVRAFNPFPVATSIFRGKVCRIWFAQQRTGAGRAGEVVALDDGILVGCGDGLLALMELQMPGGKRQTAQQFMQGLHIKKGEMFT